MKSLLIHPENNTRLEQIKQYLLAQKVDFEEVGPDNETVNDENDTDDDTAKIVSFEDFRQKRFDIKPEIINDIVDNLDTGMLCFYHKTKGELEYYPDEMHNPGFEEEFWEDVILKVEDNSDDYIRFEPMGSSEAFRVMESFVDAIDDIPTHNKFIDALSRRKPFRNFSDMLLYYPDLREQWFVYKKERYIEYVKDQIDLE